MANEKPAAELRLGALKATIWRNETEKGHRFNVNLVRLYKDQADEWQTSSSLGRDDLLPAAKLLDMAHTRIFELQAESN